MYRGAPDFGSAGPSKKGNLETMFAIVLAAYGGLTVGAPLGYLLRVKIERAPRPGSAGTGAPLGASPPPRAPAGC
jgi:hypothetical protein